MTYENEITADENKAQYKELKKRNAYVVANVLTMIKDLNKLSLDTSETGKKGEVAAIKSDFITKVEAALQV